MNLGAMIKDKIQALKEKRGGGLRGQMFDATLPVYVTLSIAMLIGLGLLMLDKFQTTTSTTSTTYLAIGQIVTDIYTNIGLVGFIFVMGLLGVGVFFAMAIMRYFRS